MEVMIAMVILSVGILGVISVYLAVSKGLIFTSGRTVSVHLAKRKMEGMKSLDYSHLIPTPEEVLPVSPAWRPSEGNAGDSSNPYPPETFTINKRVFTRYVLVRKVHDEGGVLTNLDPNSPDVGIKRVEVEVQWDEKGEDKYVYFQNLRDDPNRKPLNGTITGQVKDNPGVGSPKVLKGAAVVVLENLNWETITDSGGNYTMAVATGTYNVRASLTGYLPQTKAIVVPVELEVTLNFSLDEVDTGEIEGYISTGPFRVSGAMVSCDDGLSTPVCADATGYYLLTNVATGYWTVFASSITLCLNGHSTNLVNVTEGARGRQDVVLASSTVNGSISGYVRDPNSFGISNIIVSAGGKDGTTDVLGYYAIFDVDPATHNVVANPAYTNKSYVTDTKTGIVVEEGVNTPNVDFTLYPGGSVTGSVTVGGQNYPGVIVRAVDKNGVEQGATTTIADGTFVIEPLAAWPSFNDYTVEPVISADVLSDPEERTVEIVQGTTKTKDKSNDDITFEITPAKVEIRGTVTENGVPIGTGVLVVVSSVTIPSTPPTINYTFRAGSAVYYGTTSISEGTYTLSVRSNNTYNVAAWYTEIVGDVPTTTRQDAVAVVTSTGTVVDFGW